MALKDNLVSYWKLDESSGNAADSVGSNTLINTNTVTYSAGLINNGANFSSSNTNKMLNVATAIVSAGGDMTMNVWVKLLAEKAIDGSQWTFISMDTGTLGEQYGVTYDDSAGSRRLSGYVYDGVAVQRISENINLGTSNWHMMTLSRSGTTLTFYDNAVSVGTYTIVRSLTAPSNFSLAAADGNSNYASSLEDECGVWSRALSGAEITSLYNGGLGVQYPFFISFMPIRLNQSINRSNSF